MLSLRHCRLGGGEAFLYDVDASFVNGLHLIHFDCRAALRLWVETLTGLRAPEQGVVELPDGRVRTVYPRALPGEGTAWERALERVGEGGGLVLLAALPPAEEHRLQTLKDLCRAKGIVCICCVLETQMSTGYDHVWQVKRNKLLSIR